MPPANKLTLQAFNPSLNPIEALSTHIMGITSMIQQMGPEAFQDDTDGHHCAFITCRLALVSHPSTNSDSL